MRPSFFVIALIGVGACAPEPASDEEKISLEAGQVTIYRDQFGTPHIVADSNYDVYFGYGYAVATDRLFQMEMLRRTAEGRVAEVLGIDYLALDKHIRTAYDHRAVSRQLKSLSPADLKVLEGYAAGFSQRVDAVLADQENLLPKEFIEYDFLPEKWTSYDVAMIFIGSIIHRYSDFNSELDNLGLLNGLAKLHGEDKAKRIFDASKWLIDPTSPTTVPRSESSDLVASSIQSTPTQNRPILHDVHTKRIALDADGRFLGTTDEPAAQEVHQEQIAAHGFNSPEYTAASNFWSVTGRRLAGADGALVNGPQFDFGLPSYVYGIGLHGGDFNVVGNTLLGLPSMLFAHNGQVAWGSTAGLSDQVDVYQEHLVANKPNHYRHAGEDKAFETWVEVVKVRDADPVSVTARRSVHGMVISSDAETGIAYSRARAWEGAEVETLIAWINLAKATTMDDVQASLADIAANINFYYMDLKGSLGYTHGGRYPLRKDRHDSRIPADGRGENDWLGFRPYSDNPNTRDPEQGYIVNWNNRPGAGWLASDLWSYTWSKADRSWHIIGELGAEKKMSTNDVWSIAKKVSYDDVSGVFLMPYLNDAVAGYDLDPITTLAYQTLSEWDGEWLADNSNGNYGAAELIMETWSKHLFEQVLKDDVGAEKFALYSATNNPNHPLGASMVSSVGAKVLLRNLQTLNSDTDSYDFFNGADPSTVLAQTFIGSIAMLARQHGDDLSKWSLAPAPMTWKPFNFRGVPQASKEALVSLPAYMNRGSENNFFIARDGQFIAYDVIPPGQSGFVSQAGEISPHGRDQMSLYSDFEYKTIPFTLEQVREHAVSSESITLGDDSKASVVENIQAVFDSAEKQSHLGAFIYLGKEAALAAAEKADRIVGERGMLHGIPLVVKDNIHVAGMPNSAGTNTLKNFVPRVNNPVIEQLINAGGIIVGKTNMHELAFGITSNNSAFGPVRNAINSEMIAGGSSGGTAVAIAAGIVDMGLGTDTGGSTRIPAAINGIAGFRPTMGRYPGGAVTPISSTRDTLGPMANSVENVALLDAAITQDSNELAIIAPSKIRLGVPSNYFYEGLSKEVGEITQTSLNRLSEAGVQLVDVDMPGLVEANNGASFPIVFYEVVREMPAYLDEYSTGVSYSQLVDGIASPDVKGAFDSQSGEQAMSAEAYRQAIEVHRPALQNIYQQTFKTHHLDAIIVPSTPITATPIATSDATVSVNGVEQGTFPTFIQNTDPSSNAGIPSLTIPAGLTKSGMPAGLLLDGPANSDRHLLAIGLTLESLLKTDQQSQK